MNSNILVTGATGQQGGAVINALTAGDFGDVNVFGLIRDSSTDRALTLEERGVTLVEGDLTNLDSLTKAFDGMDAVFGVTTFFEVGPQAEREQGYNIITAAERAGIKHLVFSSVGSADANTGLPHFNSKADIESRLVDSELSWTILRPVFFMQNLGMNVEDIENGRLALPLAESVELAVVDVADIGRAAAAAFTAPEKFRGDTITLAGDELTLAELADIPSGYLNRDVEPVHVPIEDARAAMGEEMAEMFAWFNETGYTVDITATESAFGFEFASFSEFLADSDLFVPIKPAM